MIAGDPNVIARLRELRANPGLAPQDFVNTAAAAAWSDDEHAESRRRLFAGKRQILLDFLREAGLEVVASEASFYLWVRAPKGHTGASYAEHLLEAGILTNPGSFFAVTDTGDDYFRLALVPDPDTCRDAMDAWRALNASANTSANTSAGRSG